MHTKTCLLALFFSVGSAFAAESSNWPQWRGPNAHGVALASNLPVKWDAAKPHWKIALPGKGSSTPIVWDNRIYVTVPAGGKDALLALDAEGKQLWQTVIGRGESAGRHRNGSGSNPSPVTDGKLLFVSFKSGQFAALNFDGTIRWEMDLVAKYGPVRLFWDYGTSPVLTEKHVVIARMHQGESWLAAFDKETGELRWKTPRNYQVPQEIDNGYTTPLVIQHQGREGILTWGAQHLTVHDAADGKLLWSCGNFNPGGNSLWPAVASPVVVGEIAAVCFGRADQGRPRFHGVKLSGAGDFTATNHLWDREDTGAFVPTPAVYQGKIYVLSDRGLLDCIDPATGQTVWSQPLPRASANFYASPLIAGGKIYVAREDGKVYVAQIDGGFQLLAETKVDDRVIASIVPMGSRLLIRGDTNLYCFAAQ
ncbi:MAG: PQQ-binding-like beta-propeller repeat protein [Opitutaceae bacterium]